MDLLVQAFQVYNVPSSWVLLLIGTLWGMLIGALPGVAGSLAMLTLLPFTFYMSFEQSLVLLLSAYTASIYGGSISAILLNIPGTAGNIVTTFEGWPLTQKGKAGLALGIAAIASHIGNLMSCALLMILGFGFVSVALKFGTYELFVIALWGFVLSVLVSPGNGVKNFIIGFFGLGLSFMGMDAKYGTLRYTFHNSYLMTGIPLIAAIVGLYGISSVLESIFNEKNLVLAVKQTGFKLSGFSELKRIGPWVTMVISSIIGFIIGVVPATSSVTSTLLTYGLFKKLSPRRKEYGKGCTEGIWLAESSNNATHPGAILITLALGIPGESTMVILIGCLTLHGLQGGPMLIMRNPEYLWAVTLAIVISGFATFIIAWSTMIGWVKAIELPKAVIWPFVLILCIVGTFAINNSLLDVLVALIVGIFAFFAEKNGFSKLPLVMGLVLGPIMEYNLRNSLQVGGLEGFLNRPIVLIFLVLLVAITYVFGFRSNLKNFEA